MMVISFATFIGIIAGWILNTWLYKLGLNKLINEGKAAVAVYSKKKGKWIVKGKFSKIALELAEVRKGRKPGAIKYVD